MQRSTLNALSEGVAVFGGRETDFARLLPEVTIPIGPEEFAGLAARALAPRGDPLVALVVSPGSKPRLE